MNAIDLWRMSILLGGGPESIGSNFKRSMNV